MKKIILILIFFPSFCFAQQSKSQTLAPEKPSTTACPTWNKKGKKSDKAAYFQYLRSPKTKENQQATFVTPPKRQPKEDVQRTEKTIPKRNLKQIAESTNPSPNQSGKEKTVASKSEKKEITSVEGNEEKNTVAPVAKATPTESTVEGTKEKNKTEDSKIKRKLKLMSRKTTKVHRHSNAKCPSF